MWRAFAGEEIKRRDFNEELLKIKGFIESDHEARVTFAKFLRHNLSLAADLIGGIDLYPVQHIAINAMFSKQFFLGVWGRGFSKTYTTSIFCFLYALFNPGVKIGIISKSFRQSRQIFKQIEDFADSPAGLLLRQCINERYHKNDAWEMLIGESRIVALPLGDGGKLRGWRFNCVVIDELLLMPDTIINEVIIPFLAIKYKAREREKIRIQEDELISKGLMKEEDRQVFIENKMIGLSSASYKFENLYKIYEGYEASIIGQPDGEGGWKKKPSPIHAIMQMSYEAAPKGLYDQSNIDEAKARFSEAQFKREYQAEFTDDSSGYFSMKKMNECTLKDYQEPCIELVGDKQAEYIVSVDPNYNDSETSDHFAISLLKMVKEGKPVLVHQYAVAKSNVKARIKYMAYILESFKVVYIILDSAGGKKFLEDCNNSDLFKAKKIELKDFDADFMNDDYLDALNRAKNSYNLTDYRICHVQDFNSQWIRIANEKLQSDFDHQRILFASNGGIRLDSLSNVTIPIQDLDFDPDNDIKDAKARIIDFIEHQDSLMQLVKDECALIVITTTAAGAQTFDLPQNLRRISTPDKPRKDSYSALLMANWAYKCYNDMINDKSEKPKSTFIPQLI